MTKRTIVIEIDSAPAAFGMPALKYEGGAYRRDTSISASDLSQPEITVHYHISEDSAELASFVEEIVERIKQKQQ